MRENDTFTIYVLQPWLSHSIPAPIRNMQGAVSKTRRQKKLARWHMLVVCDLNRFIWAHFKCTNNHYTFNCNSYFVWKYKYIMTTAFWWKGICLAKLYVVVVCCPFPKRAELPRRFWHCTIIGLDLEMDLNRTSNNNNLEANAGVL